MGSRGRFCEGFPVQRGRRGQLYQGAESALAAGSAGSNRRGELEYGRGLHTEWFGGAGHWRGVDPGIGPELWKHIGNYRAREKICRDHTTGAPGGAGACSHSREVIRRREWKLQRNIVFPMLLWWPRRRPNKAHPSPGSRAWWVHTTTSYFWRSTGWKKDGLAYATAIR